MEMHSPTLPDSLARTIYRPCMPEYVLSPEESLRLSQKKAVFEQLTGSFSIEVAKEASHAYSTRTQEDSTLTYGEVEFDSLGEVFESINARYGGVPRGVFYDLGSGSGKAALAAAVLHPFVHCKGIEIVPALYAISLQVKEVYDRAFPAERAARPDLFPNQSEMTFVLGSFFEIDWSDANVFFANSTCFSKKMMEKIADSYVAEGTFGITLTKPLPGPKWRLLESYKKNMSWGFATVFVQQRVSEDQQAPEAFP